MNADGVAGWAVVIRNCGGEIITAVLGSSANDDINFIKCSTMEKGIQLAGPAMR